jgi:poly(3-hydroxybutyrate) depolymerase
MEGAIVLESKNLTDTWGRGILAWTTFLATTPPWNVPADLMAWWGAVIDRKPPAWATPHEVVATWPLARLRDFSPAGSLDVIPTLVLAPNAGHDSCIADYDAGQSQMRTILAAGLARAYCIDWIGANSATKRCGIADYVHVVDEAVRLIAGEGPVNLIGDCQGGWLAAIYAALYPNRVNTLTVAGAPIDTWAGDGPLRALTTRLTPGGNMAMYEWLVAAAGGVMPGQYMLAGFMSMQPGRDAATQLELLGGIHDPDRVRRHIQFQRWYKTTQDLPGPFYLEAVRRLFVNNELFRGLFTVDGVGVDLAAITAPIFTLGGATDHITPTSQVHALASAVSTPPGRIYCDETPGGHLGLFMGREALERHWLPMLSIVRRYSMR